MNGHLDVVNVLIAAGKEDHTLCCPCKKLCVAFELKLIYINLETRSIGEGW